MITLTKPVPPPDFACPMTSTRLCNEVIPLLEEIASAEFRAVVMQNPDIDESDENDMNLSVQMMSGILCGYLKAQKEMYLKYGRSLTKLLFSDSQEELNQLACRLCEID